MGTVSFLLPAGLKPEEVQELERACMAGGPDNMPWPTDVRVNGDQLTLRRSVDESGYLVVPWDIEGMGRLMGTTATLMERALPYHLQVEMARGKVNQLRCQAADWKAGGLQVPQDLARQIHEASIAFGHAATQDPPDRAGQDAQSALNLGYQAAARLVQVYVEQVFQIRQQRQAQLDTALGCRLSTRLPTGEAA